MARRRSVPLTEVEQRLMEIVWAHGPVTVGQVVEAIPSGVGSRLRLGRR